MISALQKISRFSPWLLLCLILFLALWIRFQGVAAIPDGQFTGNDPYLYYWQAQIVSEHGRLPARDMHRWLPLGRDLGQSLNAYSYAIAYVHKVIAILFPSVSLYQTTLFAPVICFLFGLGVLYFFLYRTFRILFSSIVGVLLATLPGVIERSTAGFSDSDSWCLMLGVLVVTVHLASLQSQCSRSRLVWILVSGFTVFLGGMSWEGFGVFLSIILCVELWKFLATEREEGLGLYFLWMCTFVPILYLASPAYRRGDSFATHLFAFVLVPPLVLLGMRILRYLWGTKVPLANKLHLHAKNLSLGLTFVSLALAIGYVWIQFDTFTSTTVPLQQNQLMQTVGELNAPDYRYWVFRYGSLFFFSSLGLISVGIHLWSARGTVLGVPLLLFILATFFRGRVETLLGTTGCNALFFISLGGISLMFLFIAWRQREAPRHEYIYIAMMIWFLLWVALSRDAKRYDFFVGVPMVFFTAKFICLGTSILIEKIRRSQFLNPDFGKKLSGQMIGSGAVIIMVVLLMYWPPAGAHARRAISAATQMRPAKPGNTGVAEAFEWMRKELSDTAIVAASWGYGSQLNVLGGVKTIIDQDHYIQYWIYLYNKYVRDATDARAALEFLETHGVTHLMLTRRNPAEVYLKGELSAAFVPVYPTDNFAEAKVKVWQIRYPPEIQINPKYLATKPEE